MKNLNQFNRFDMEEFSKGKVYMATACREWKDFDTGSHQGTVIDVAIIKDETPYKQKENESVTNLYEKLSFKVSKDITIPVNARVVPINAIGVIYGQYRNQLSVRCDDIRIITANAPQVSTATKSELLKTP